MTRFWLLCIFGIYCVLALGRGQTSLPWCDEGWFFNPVYNWIAHGYTGTTVVESKGLPWEGIERHQYWQPPFHLIVDFVWLKAFGMSLASIRGLSTFAGVVVLLFWTFLLNFFRVPFPVKLLSLTLIATDYTFVRAGSDGRTDMVAAAFGLGAVVAYIGLRENRFTLAVILSQTLVVCGGLTHPMGGLLYLALIAYFFVKGKDWRRAKAWHLGLAALPYAVGAGGWGAYIAQDPQVFRKIFLGSSIAGRLSGTLHPLLAIRDEFFERYLAPFGWYGQGWAFKLKLLIPITYLAGAALVCCIGRLRRESYLQPFLSMWAIACVCMLVLDSQRNGTYLVHVFPLYAILLASLVNWMYKNQYVPRAVTVLFAAGFLLLQVGGSLYVIWTNPYREQYRPVINFVREHSRPGDRVVGTAELGFGLGFDNLHDDIALGYYVRKKPDVVVLCPRYRAWYEAIRGDGPLYDFIGTRLSKEFQLAYQTEAFQVYLPKPPAGSQ